MKVILAVIVVIVLAVIGFFAINPSGKETKKDIFYYYPKANVYFDEATDEYLFLGADSKTWQNNKQLPREQQDSLGKKIQIPNPKTPVWKDNEYHRLVYGTALYKTDDIEKKFYEDSLKNISKKSIADKAKSESDDDKDKKHRSGIKKFFDKIFK